MEHDHGKMAPATGYDTEPKGHTGTVYTCPMHDEVRSICPICNITLVSDSKSATSVISVPHSDLKTMPPVPHDNAKPQDRLRQSEHSEKVTGRLKQ